MSKILIGKHQATIYPEDNGYIGSISLGFDGKGNRHRVKRRGRTKAAVKDKLVKAVEELEAGLQPAEGYTVKDAVNDWLAKGLKGRDENTLATNGILAEQHVIPLIGAKKVKELTADDVDEWLEGLTGKLATRSLQGSTRSSNGQSGKRRPATRYCATWPNWSRPPRASRDAPAGP